MNGCILYVYCRKGTKTLVTVTVLADLPEYTMHCILEIIQHVQNVGRRRRVGLQPTRLHCHPRARFSKVPDFLKFFL